MILMLLFAACSLTQQIPSKANDPMYYKQTTDGLTKNEIVLKLRKLLLSDSDNEGLFFSNDLISQDKLVCYWHEITKIDIHEITNATMNLMSGCFPVKINPSEIEDIRKSVRIIYIKGKNFKDRQKIPIVVENTSTGINTNKDEQVHALILKMIELSSP